MSNSAKRKSDEGMGKSNKKDKRDIPEQEKDFLLCNWCKIELPNEESMILHLLEQKHKKLNDPEDEKKRIDQKCGLFIRGFPPDVNKNTILEYFLKFGKIVFVHCDHSFILLDYDKPEPAEKVISKVHYLAGRRLMIKYRQHRRQGPFKTSNEEDTKDLIQKLKDIPNFDDQFKVLCQNLQPVIQQQFPKYNKLCDDLYKVLRHPFPYCQIHPFGSTITGLGFNNSDVDAFISGIKDGNNDVRFLYIIKSRLVESKLFVSVFVIPQAKIPILKCVHVETGISCDINLKNMLGVCNSHLINYYLNINVKLRKLMIVLKFWAKTHKITGQNHLFTNYSLNLMLIFFLQHHPFRLPPVIALQQNPHYHNNQDGWNGGFQPLHVVSSKLRDLSLLNILEMFFSFYIEYEYGINVICPYLGTSVRKDLFKEPGKLPSCFPLYKLHLAENENPLKVDAAVCIQDPFEHSRNVTPIVTSATLESFVSFCRLGKKFCGEKNETAILYKLLTERPPEIANLTVAKSGLSQFSIPMRPSLKYIEEKHKTVAERHRAWFESMAGFTKIVLKDFLLFDVTEISNSDSKNKHKKADGQTDVYEKPMRVCYKCTGKLNLWQGRKSVAKNNKQESEEGKMDVIKKETAITQQMYEQYKEVTPLDDIINFEISLEFCIDPPNVTISVKKIEAYKNSFTSFMSFLSARLPTWFKTFEQEQN